MPGGKGKGEGGRRGSDDDNWDAEDDDDRDDDEFFCMGSSALDNAIAARSWPVIMWHPSTQKSASRNR